MPRSCLIIAARCLAALSIAALAASSVGAQDETAERIYLAAQRLEREGEIDEARREYELVVSRFPETTYAQQALLHLAESYHASGEMEETFGALERLAEGFPDSPQAAAALVLRGRYQVEAAAVREDLDEALRPLRRAQDLFGVSEYPALLARVEARVRRGWVHLLLGEADQAALDFLGAIEEERRSVWVPEALLGFAQSLVMKADFIGAADVLQRVIDQPDSSEELRRRARTSLALVHRHWLRPELGQERWLSSRPFPIQGASPRRPARIAARDDGALVVLDGGQDQALVLDATGQLTARKTVEKARDVAWGVDGEAYASAGDVMVGVTTSVRQGFSPGGVVIKNIGTGQRGLFQEWIVLDAGKKTLWSLDREGKPHRLATNVADIADSALAPRGGLLTLDRKEGSVTRYDISGSRAGTVRGDWRRPEAVSSDALGNIYVLDTASRSVHVRTPQGERIATVGPGLPGGQELRTPEDIAVDGAGRLFVLDRGLGQILVVE